MKNEKLRLENEKMGRHFCSALQEVLQAEYL